jgi:hypothetical protein
LVIVLAGAPSWAVGEGCTCAVVARGMRVAAAIALLPAKTLRRESPLGKPGLYAMQILPSSNYWRHGIAKRMTDNVATPMLRRHC